MSEHAAPAGTVPPRPIPPSRLVLRLQDPVRLAQIIQSARDLFGEDDGTGFVRTLLLDADLPAPPARNANDLMTALLPHRWRPLVTPRTNPVPGALYFQVDSDGEIARVGVVGKVVKSGKEILREFQRAGAAPDEPRVHCRDVAFFLLSPDACGPCAWRGSSVRATPVLAT